MTTTNFTLGTQLTDEQLRQLGFKRWSLIIEEKKEATIVPKHAFKHLVDDIVSHKRKLHVVQELIKHRLLGLFQQRKDVDNNPTYNIFPSWFKCYITTLSQSQIQELAKVFGVDANSVQSVKR